MVLTLLILDHFDCKYLIALPRESFKKIVPENNLRNMQRITIRNRAILITLADEVNTTVCACAKHPEFARLFREEIEDFMSDDGILTKKKIMYALNSAEMKYSVAIL